MANILYLPFDESTGTTAIDYSGNGNNGTLAGATLPTWVTGKYGTALNFDGTSSIVTLTSRIVLSGTYSISIWFKRTDLSGIHMLIADSTNAEKIGLDVGGQFWIRPASDGAGSIIGGIAGPVMATGSWIHVVIVRNAAMNTLTAYVNSKAYTLWSQDVSGNLDLNLIGNDNFTNYFKGIIDNIIVFDYELTATQVQNLYLYNNLVYPAQLFYLPLNEGAGSIAYDQSGNGCNGTIVGATWTTGGIFGGPALSFDGTDSNTVTLTNIPQTELGLTDFSIAFWMKYSDKTIRRYVISKTGSRWWLVTLKTDGTVFGRFSGTDNTQGTDIYGTQDLSDGAWHFVVIVCKREHKKLTLFVDNMQTHWHLRLLFQAILDLTTGHGYNAILNGWSVDGPGLDYKGLLNGVRGFNFALSTYQINNLYINNSLYPASVQLTRIKIVGP